MSGDFQQTSTEQPLGGRYKVISQLGTGGFGQTFLAEDLHLPGHPECVVKQLKPQSNSSETLGMARRLFDTEAEVLYQLGNHNQIPRLLAHFEDHEEFYLALEFIEGHPLTKELITGKPWPEAQVIDLLQDILQVLAFVHEQQVIHRDLKPPNMIRRRSDGRIVLIDFGAVKQVSSQVINPETGETNLTISIGTKGYMPNEQLAGNPRFSSDVYAIGMLGIQALIGLHPKRLGEDPQTGEILWREHAPEVTSELADVLDRMVRYDFRDRYLTAAHALEALQNLPTYLEPLPPPQLPTSSPKAPSIPEQPLPSDLEPTDIESPSELDPTTQWEPTETTPQMVSGSEDTTTPLSQLQLPELPTETLTTPPNTRQELLQNQWAKLWPWLAVVAAVGVTFVVTKTLFSTQFASRSLNRGSVSGNPTPMPTPIPPTPKPPPRKPTAEELLKEGERLRIAGQCREAMKRYDEVIELKPKQAEAYWGRCYCYNKLEQPNEALVSCNDALDLKARYPEAMWGKGNALEEQKRLSDALALYEQAIIRKRKFPEAWVSRGVVLQKLGRSYEAVWALDEAIKLNRNVPEPWAVKGEALWDLRRRDEAIVALDKALQLDPNYPKALELREKIRKETGR
jgi:serine/threonine protein kinase